MVKKSYRDKACGKAKIKYLRQRKLWYTLLCRVFTVDYGRSRTTTPLLTITPNIDLDL